MKLLLFAALPALLLGQAQFRKVDPQLTHDRIIAIVPIIGTGTTNDPKRPQYTDAPGLTGFTAELSDDGRHALVEFVAKDRKLLDIIANSGQRLERKESFTKDSIYEDFKRYKKSFKQERFGLALP